MSTSIFQLFAPPSSWGIFSRQPSLTKTQEAQKELIEEVFKNIQSLETHDVSKLKGKIQRNNLEFRPVKIDLSLCSDLGRDGLINVFRHTKKIDKLILDCSLFDDDAVKAAIPYLKQNSPNLKSLRLTSCSKEVLSSYLAAFPRLEKLNLGSINMTTPEYREILLSWMKENPFLQSVPCYTIDALEQIEPFVSALPSSIRKIVLESTENDFFKTVIDEVAKKVGTKIESGTFIFNGWTPPGWDSQIFTDLPANFPNLKYLNFQDIFQIDSPTMLKTYMQWQINGMTKFPLGSTNINTTDLLALIMAFSPTELDLGIYSPNLNYDSLNKIIPALVKQNKLEKLKLPSTIEFSKQPDNTIDPAIQQLGPLLKKMKSFNPYTWDNFNAATLTFIGDNFGPALTEFNLQTTKGGFWDQKVVEDVCVTVGKNSPHVKQLVLKNVIPYPDFGESLLKIADAYSNLEVLSLVGSGTFPFQLWQSIERFVKNNPNLHVIYLGGFISEEDIDQYRIAHPEMAKRVNLVYVST